MEENHVHKMSIFEPPPTDTAIQVREWIEFRPVNQLGEDAAIEFHVPPQSTGYMDLKLCRLNVKIKITKADETSVTRDDVVSLINLPLHGMFSQIECQLQQKSVSDVGTNYPYKAYIDTLMTTDESKHVFNSSQLFIKDTSGQFDSPDAKTGPNLGLFERWTYTRDGGLLDLEGALILDVFQQDRLILNGVSLDLKLWPSRNSFRLMSDSLEPNEKLKIVDATLKMCIQRPNPALTMAHTRELEEATAIYPYMTSTIKIASIAEHVSRGGTFAIDIRISVQQRIQRKL